MSSATLTLVRWPTVLVLSMAAFGCHSRESHKTATDGAIALPDNPAVDGDVERRFLVREVNLVGCDTGPCTTLVAIDAENGNRDVVHEIAFADDAPNVEVARAAITRGDLLVVGRVRQRFRDDTIEGKSTPKGSKPTDLVLYVRDTESAMENKLLASMIARNPFEMAASACPEQIRETAQLRADDRFVYWSPCGTLSRLDKEGGQSGKPLTITPNMQDAAFTLDGEYVYWRHYQSGQLVRARKDGSDYSVVSKRYGARSLAADATHFYWIDREVAKPAESEIVRMRKSDGELTTLTTSGDSIDELTLDETSIYFATTTRDMSHSVSVIGKGGGPLRTIASSSGSAKPRSQTVDHPSALTIDGTDVYWANVCVGCPVVSAPKAGGEITTHAAALDTSGVGLAISGESLYFTTYGSRVFRVKKRESTPPFAARPVKNGGTSTLVVDAKYIYWVRSMAPQSATTSFLVRMPIPN